MNQDDVTVFSFYVADGRVPEVPLLSTFKATRQAISSIPGALVAEGTSMSVPAAELDEFGRFFWRPTGWGDLA